MAAELAMFRVFNQYPGSKCVYIAPLKALVRERIEDWSNRLDHTLKKRCVQQHMFTNYDAHCTFS